MASAANRLTPYQTLGGQQGGTYFADAKSVDVGWNRTCALTNAGNVYCWGDGAANSLGHGIFQLELSPIKVLGGTQGGTYLENVTSLTYGMAHACAVTTTKEMYCWGWTGVFTTYPDQIAGGAQGSTYLSNITGVFAGSTFTCAIDANDKPYCWGYNDSGQLGLGTTNTSYDTSPAFLGF